MRIALIFWVLINLLLLLVSFMKVKNSGKKLGFIYKWGFLWGAFVWEDMLFISFFQVVASYVTLLIGDFKFYLLFLLVFWVVRSFGEVIYFLLQQFIRPRHYPHRIESHFKLLYGIFGKLSDQKFYIIMQMLLQVVLVVSLSLLTLLLLNWDKTHYYF